MQKYIFSSLMSLASGRIQCLQVSVLIFSLQWEAWCVGVLNNNPSQKTVTSSERGISNPKSIPYSKCLNMPFVNLE